MTRTYYNQHDGKWTEEDIQIVKENYPIGGWQAVMPLLSMERTKQSIIAKASSLGVKKLSYNKDYFEKIDSKEKAYWLGFIYADGNIDSQKRFTINLSTEDKDHLQKLANAMESNIIIRDRVVNRDLTGNGESKDYFSSSLSIKNIKIYNDLKRHGVNERKTFNISFPKINKKYLPDFIRGFFDGDGSVGLYDDKSTKSSKLPKIEIVCAVKEFLIDMKDYLGSIGIECNYNYDEPRNLHKIYIKNKDNCLMFFDKIYGDSNKNNRLERKYDKFMEILKYYKEVV